MHLHVGYMNVSQAVCIAGLFPYFLLSVRICMGMNMCNDGSSAQPFAACNLKQSEILFNINKAIALLSPPVPTGSYCALAPVL